MERVEDCSSSIEVFENDIDLYLHQFQDEQGFEDLRTVPQTVWNACLMYIQRHVFTNRNDLKQKKNIYTKNTITETNCNSYDYELLNNICDYYIYITALYDKECSIYGYSKLVNIPYQTIMEWGNNYNNRDRLSSSSGEIYKKLTNEREQSLVAKLMSMKHPTAIAIVLNKDYSYNLPGVSREVNKVSVSASELPKLGGNLSAPDGINQNPVQIAQDNVVLENCKNPQSLVNKGLGTY
jgi:hypothetical protein